jgi:hypothetical protein
VIRFGEIELAFIRVEDSARRDLRAPVMHQTGVANVPASPCEVSRRAQSALLNHRRIARSLRSRRLLTTGGWSYVTIEPGVYLWRSPLGYQYLRDHTGTVDVTPDADRRRLARRFLAHLDDTGGDHPPDT